MTESGIHTVWECSGEQFTSVPLGYRIPPPAATIHCWRRFYWNSFFVYTGCYKWDCRSEFTMAFGIIILRKYQYEQVEIWHLKRLDQTCRLLMTSTKFTVYGLRSHPVSPCMQLWNLCWKRCSTNNNQLQEIFSITRLEVWMYILGLPKGFFVIELISNYWCYYNVDQLVNFSRGIYYSLLWFMPLEQSLG